MVQEQCQTYPIVDTSTTSENGLRDSRKSSRMPTSRSRTSVVGSTLFKWLTPVEKIIVLDIVHEYMCTIRGCDGWIEYTRDPRLEDRGLREFGSREDPQVFLRTEDVTWGELLVQGCLPSFVRSASGKTLGASGHNPYPYGVVLDRS